MLNFEELANQRCKEREGTKLFKEGSVVYIHPDIIESHRSPSVVPEMTTFAGYKCEITYKNARTYTLSCIDPNEEHRKQFNRAYNWADWMLLSESEMNELEADPAEFLSLL
jgi:hypothetical protein